MEAHQDAALPPYLAPLPRQVEDLALRLAWPLVAVNLAGTAFGFWYYRFQFAAEPLVAWPVVPDSPTATLFVALSLAAWKLGRPREWLSVLAFFGCIKLGLWTPYVLWVFRAEFSYLHPAMYAFLFLSHLGMAAQAFLVHRYSNFPLDAVAVALIWYGFNDLVDYFLPVVGEPHHTWIPSEIVDGVVIHTVPAHDLAAVAAVSLTVAATVLAVATRAAKETGRDLG